MKKVNVKIFTTRIKYLKWSFRPAFKREREFCNEEIAMLKEKCRKILNKSNYIRANILEKKFSQLLQYSF